MRVEPGRYDLVISRDGYSPSGRKVTVSTAECVLTVVLKRSNTNSRCRPRPAASTIKFDNSKLEYGRHGAGPGALRSGGDHEGYQSERRQVTISMPMSRCGHFTLRKNTNSRCRRPRPIAASNLIIAHWSTGPAWSWPRGATIW